MKYIFISFILLIILIAFTGCSVENTTNNIINNTVGNTVGNTVENNVDSQQELYMFPMYNGKTITMIPMYR